MARRLTKIGLVQMAMSNNLDANLRAALSGVDEAARKGAKVICLPELFAWRYFPATRNSYQIPQSIPGPVSRALSQSARKNGVVLVGGTIYEKAGKFRYNTCLVFDGDGRTLTKYRKVHIPQDEHYFEQDYFTSGVGYKVAKTTAGRLGTLICFDQWYPEAARVNRLMGADILFYPTAIGWVKGIEPVEGDWKQAWESVQIGHAIANSVLVCAVNRVGSEGETDFWGGSFVCDQFGKILFRAGREEGVFTVDCDLGLAKTVEEGWGFMHNRKKKTYAAISK
ncbi:MAG TPA: nitrilase-related carbon-nitrogen hydrolase [Nitrososphaerales archaeon]|nr:nitrilase-related carbon-nitrogen hydrolase [Nitrososphaerales archaeon]